MTPEQRVRRHSDKIRRGLENAIAYAKGDKSKGRKTTFRVRKPKKPRVRKGWAEFHANGRLFKDGLGNVLVYGRRPDKRMRQIMGDVRPVIITAPKKRGKK